MSQEKTNGQSGFLEWAERGFGSELIPIHAWNDTSVTDERRGKKPLVQDWVTIEVTSSLLEAWSHRPINIGLRTRHFPCLDVDIDDGVIAAAVREVANRMAGVDIPCRFRSNSHRIALLYKLGGSPFTKKTIKFKLPNGDDAKVEFLASGQQTVVWGTHTSGSTLEWVSIPVAGNLPELTANRRDVLMAAIQVRLQELGCTLKVIERESPSVLASHVPGDWAKDADIAERACAAIDPDTDYDEWIRVGMALHSKYPDISGPGFELWNRWSAGGKEKYRGLEDLEAHWKSFRAGDVHFGTLVRMGGVRPNLKIAEELPEEPGGIVDDDHDDLPSELHNGAWILSAKLPAIEYVCDPYLPKREVIEVTGPHGHYKSTIMLYACLSCATGIPWCGASVVKGKAAFITLEDTASVIQARTLAWLAGLDEELRDGAIADMESNFFCLSRSDAQELALTYVNDRRQVSLSIRSVERIISLCSGFQLISLETSARLHPGPEDHMGLSALASACERVATGTGAGVMVGRHVPKEVARSGKMDSYAGSGAAVFSNAARSILTVMQEGRVHKPGEDVDEEPPDPFDVVRLVQTKSPPLSARGEPLSWKPKHIDVCGGVQIYLSPWTSELEVRSDALKMYRYLAEAGELSKDEINKRSIHKIGKKRKNDAIKKLVADGKASWVEVPGLNRNGKTKWVLRPK